MGIFRLVCGALLFLLTAWDAFEAAVMPRSVISFFRFTRYFHKIFWRFWSFIAHLCGNRGRELILGMYGPLSTLLLIPLWALGLVTGIAFIQWGLDDLSHTHSSSSFFADLLNTASCFVTLGLQRHGHSAITQALAVFTAGIGLGFLALVIGYMPILYQAFSRRESGILLLDARAGSPPCGAELIRRHVQANQLAALSQFFQEAERWCAELLESHLSYPTLTAYRSQHDRVSWLSAITALLDAAALIKAGLPLNTDTERYLAWRAHCCFAMARHAVVDLSYIQAAHPTRHSAPNRLPDDQLQRLVHFLEDTSLSLAQNENLAKFNALRQEYEPYVQSLAMTLLFELPPWLPPPNAHDNWQSGLHDQTAHFYRA